MCVILMIFFGLFGNVFFEFGMYGMLVLIIVCFVVILLFIMWIVFGCGLMNVKFDCLMCFVKLVFFDRKL